MISSVSVTAPIPASNPAPTQVVQAQPVQNVVVPNLAPVSVPIPAVPVQPVSKPIQDSLAPLIVPSKPIVYVEEPAKTTENESDNRSDEKAKFDTFMINSMTKLNTETNLAKKFLGMTSRFNGLNQQVLNPADRPIPTGYVCVICRKPGHLKQFCPEAGTLPKPEDRPKYPSGIPRTNLRPAQPNEKFAMLGPEGYVVTEIDQKAAKIVKKDKILFDDDEEEGYKKNEKKNIQEPSQKIPNDLQCPFGGHLIKDAVLVPCCGHFICCDECIKRKIENEEQIECPHEKCDQEIGPLVSITPFHEIRKKVQEYLKNSKSNESKDPFLDLIFDEVDKNELKVSLNGSKSPVQDSNVTSSEKASAEQAQAASVIASNSPKSEENKLSLSPGQIISVPNKPNIVAPPQFQPRPRPNFNTNFRQNIVPLTNNYSSHPPRPIMHNNFNPIYRPPFQSPFDAMGVPMGVPMGPMGPIGGPMIPPNGPYIPPGMISPQMPHGMFQSNMMPGMMQNVAHGHGIASKEEFYEYQEKLRKEAEMKIKGSYKRSRSKSRSRYSRSRSRSRGKYRSMRYRRSKSRSRSRNRTRDRNYKRYSRSRSRSRRRSRSKDRNRESKTRGSRGDSKLKSTRASSKEKKTEKCEKKDNIKLSNITENVVVTIGKSNERQVTSDEVEKRKKSEVEKNQREKSFDSSSSDKESEKESGDGTKRQKHKHKKSKKKHKRRSSSKH